MRYENVAVVFSHFANYKGEEKNGDESERGIVKLLPVVVVLVHVVVVHVHVHIHPHIAS